MSKKENEVAETKNNLPAAPAMDFAADAGMGQENVDSKSCAIPFLTVLQGQSPQIETVDGAKPGMFINTITNELYKEVLVVPCAYQRRFIRWSPRSTGGGFKGEYNPVDVESGTLAGMSNEGGVLMMDVPAGAAPFDPKGLPLYDHLADTRNHFVLAQTAAGNWVPALISLASTQIKKSKRWMSLILGIELRNAAGKAFTPPSFSHIYKLTTIKEENAKGAWHGVVVSLVGQVEDPELYTKAKAFYSSVMAGQIEVAQPQQDVPADASDDDRF